MGDVRFLRPLDRLLQARDLLDEIEDLADGALVEALAASSREPYLANVVTSELQNRIRLKNAVLAAAGEGLCALDPLRRIRFLNPTAERILGWRAEEVQNRDFHALVHEDCDARLQGACPLDSPPLRRFALRVEDDRFTCKAGDLIPVTYTLTPLLRDGEVDGFVLVLQETAHTARLIEALSRAEQELREWHALAGVATWTCDFQTRAFRCSDASALKLPEATTWDAFLSRLAPASRDALERAVANAGPDSAVFRLGLRLAQFPPSDGILHVAGKVALGRAGRAARARGVLQTIPLGHA